MSKSFLILLMLFLHIVDDYYLQGLLASLKQKRWWEEHAPQKLYRYDYIVAVAMHSISWSFMIMLPIAYESHFNVSIAFNFVFALNAALHGIVDDLKANKRKINLIADQSFHLFQITITAIVFFGGVI